MKRGNECSESGCGRVVHARNRCEPHYRQWVKLNRSLILRTTEERFWAKVNKNGPVVRAELGECWVWIGAPRDDDGYGAFGYTHGGRTRHLGAHRFAYLLHFGAIPEGLWICHRCDNPPCVRWDHLFADTPTANVRDMISKGREGYLRGEENFARRHPERMQRGEARPNAKLTESAVRDIRERYALGTANHRVLADEYGVPQSSISRIIQRQQWAHVV